MYVKNYYVMLKYCYIYNNDYLYKVVEMFYKYKYE